MPRTDAVTIRQTFAADFSSQTGDDADISPAAVQQSIAKATQLTDRVADAGAADNGPLLTEIETLLAQHFLATSRPRAQSQSGPTRSISYQGETGEGLMATHYGQDAITLDPTGTLAEADGGSRDIIVSG